MKKPIYLISSKSLLNILLVAAVFLILVGCHSNSTKIPLPKKVIFILTDDIGAEWFGPYGCISQKTPRIDQLASSGYIFDNFSALPLCSPSRQTILTGTHQHHRREYGWTMPGNTPTFLQILNQNGFKSGVFGKWHGFDRETSFTEFKVDDYTIYSKGDRRFWNPETIENGVLKQYKETDFGPDIYNIKLLNFLTENKDEKFFAYYSMALSHWPFVTTPESIDKNEKDWQKNFTDMVNYTDKMVGQVMDHLEQLGITDETMVIFTSDNGSYPELMAELNSGEIIKGGKSFPLQSGQRVPFIVSYGKYFKHRRIQDVADFKDIFPSLMDIARVKELPEEYAKLEGESLMPLLINSEPRQKEFSLSYFEAVGGREDMRALHVRNQDWKLYSDGRLIDLKKDINEYKFTTGFGENKVKKSARKELQNELDRLRETDEDYRIVEDMLNKENGKTIGCWTPSQINLSETHQLTIDFSPFIDNRKSYTFGIQHFKGFGGVNISNVILLKNGNPIGSDEHESSSAWVVGSYQFAITKEKIYYNLNFEESLDTNAKYELRYNITQVVKGDSYGYVKLLPKNFKEPVLKENNLKLIK
jgi:arylsulfatase A